jgi:hypothetical protein
MMALHMLTHGTMWGCGLTTLVVCIYNKFHDIRERNVTIKSEIWTTNICSLGLWDIRECVTLWRSILRSLKCNIKRVFKIMIMQVKFIGIQQSKITTKQNLLPSKTMTYK